MNRTGTIAFYHADGLGSITSITDSTGSALAAYTRNSFGMSLNSAGSLVNPYRYTAREWDSETGLYYYRARYYDASIGRFITEDPAQEDDNFYKYTSNSLIDWVDPSGLVVSAPGFAESLIPVWGSGRQSVHDYQCGHYIWGTVNAALAVSDVFLVKSLATTAGKVGVEGLVKVSGSHTWDATRKWVAREGWRDFSGQAFHHWAIPQNGWGRIVPDVVKNQPWNIMKLSPEAHTELHQMEGLARVWNGTPTWFKVAVFDASGKAANAARKDCGCE
jgi:RHS repeat-associated protein